MNNDVNAVYDAARALGAELTAMSWNGFNLFGDKKSIDELQRLMTMEARVMSLQRIIDDMHKREV